MTSNSGAPPTATETAACFRGAVTSSILAAIFTFYYVLNQVNWMIVHHLMSGVAIQTYLIWAAFVAAFVMMVLAFVANRWEFHLGVIIATWALLLFFRGPGHEQAIAPLATSMAAAGVCLVFFMPPASEKLSRHSKG